MARNKKKTFKCDNCRVKLKSSYDTARHFKKHPSHRNHRQQIQWEYSQGAIQERGGPVRKGIFDGDLPTVKSGKMRVVRAQKFCTGCGNQRRANHNFCGGCGERLSA